MENNQEIKTQIRKAIAAFSNNNLVEQGVELFRTLNYKIGDFNKIGGTKSDFNNAYLTDNSKNFNKTKALYENWNEIEWLFQFSANEEQIENVKKDNKEIYSIAFMAIELIAQENEKPYARWQLADITREMNKLFSFPVVIIFQHQEFISISIADRRINKIDNSRDVTGKITLIKDISIENTHRAHIEMIANLEYNYLINKFRDKGFVDIFDAWIKTLDTKELNKQFFRKIANWYFWAVDNSTFHYEYLKKDNKLIDKTDEELQILANKKAIIRFITRIIFVWFIKEKKFVPEWLFDKTKIDEILKKGSDKNYYNAILQNLFFATLNKPKEKREFALKQEFNKNRENFDVNSLYRYEYMFVDSNIEIIKSYFADIPFLNGGLFDCLDRKDEKDRRIIDGFSRNDRWRAKMPDKLFFGAEVDYSQNLNNIYSTSTKKYIVKGLFEIFGEYKFTVEENTPEEQDVALDPVLLGEIFENLLAYYNPETSTTARKGTGSFYTPQPIVSYMVNESLKQYLKTNLDFEFDFENIENNTQEHKKLIVDALANVKILDPACGSGAFPMGILTKMVEILKSIDPQNYFWKQIQKNILLQKLDKTYDEKDKDKRAQEVKKLENDFDDNCEDYGRKLYLIRNCIYGVDIQDVAIQISKLRFFLSLAIEQDKKTTEPAPLPNLETKFVVANTLIGIDLPKPDVFENTGDSKIFNEVQNKLYENKERYFNIHTRQEKKKLQEEYKNLKHQLTQIIKNSGKEYIENNIEKLKNDIISLENKIADIEKLPKNIEIIKEKDIFGKTTETKIDKNKIEINKLKAVIIEINGKITKLNNDISNDKTIEAAKKFEQWDIYDQNSVADWFDKEWMFDIKNGFDIVIGNPPYGAIIDNEQKKYFKTNYLTTKTIKDIQKGSMDTYTLFIELGHKILKTNGNLIYIVPISITSSDSITGVHNLLEKTCSEIKISSYAVRPQPVFENAVVDVAILFFIKDMEINKGIYTTKMYRKNKNFNLEYLINNLEFVEISKLKLFGRYPKISKLIEKRILEKLLEFRTTLSDLTNQSNNKIYYRFAGGRYFKVITNYSTGSSAEKFYSFDENLYNIIGAVLSSNLFFWYYQIFSDNHNLKSSDIENFTLPIEQLTEDKKQEIELIYSEYLQDIEKNAKVRKTEKYANIDSFKEYKIRLSKHLIDKIDDVICPLYGLTKEETEFIKNYEIEFRVSEVE